MKRCYAIVLWVACLCSLYVLPVQLNAQSSAHPIEHYTCGSDWAQRVDYDAVNERTQRENPEVYRALVAHAKQQENGGPALASRAAANGLVDEFWLVNRSTGQQEKHTAVSRYVSDRTIIWVDVLDTVPGKITQQTIDRLAIGLEEKVKDGPNTRDPNTGLIQNDIAIFGSPPMDQWTQEEDFIHLLLLDIDDGDLTGGTLGGYFSPNDQDPGALGSNNRNLLYIDSPQLYGNPNEAAVNDVLGTCAHEFQHLINYRHYEGGTNNRETHWIYNEGLSEVASLRNGYMDRTARSVMARPNEFAYFDAPIGAFSGDTILPGYERGMLWCHYLSEQFGDAFLKELVKAPGRHLEPAQTALTAIGRQEDMSRVFTEFWVANYLQNAENSQNDERFFYRLSIGGRSASTISKVFPASGMVNEEVQIKGYASLLPRYTNTDIANCGLKVRFLSNGEQYGVHAIIFRNGGGIDIQSLAIEETYSFENLSAVVFAIASLDDGEQSVQWTAEKQTIGVEDYTTDAGILSVTNVAPNPVHNEVQVDFRTKAAGQVALDLYDIQGQVVKRILDNARYEGGQHTVVVQVNDLPAGAYTMRLKDSSGSLSVRQIVVVK